MRIALAQIASPADESAADRRARVAEFLRPVEGVDLLVLPELWAVGFNAFDQYESEAEPLDGPTVQMCAELARSRSMYVHAGSIVERCPDGRLRNTAVVLDPHGEVALTYSKVHVFGYASREVELLTPGNSVGVHATPMGRLSTTTCYDLRFPGLWNDLVDAGAELVVVPAAWPLARLEHWRLLTAARAVDTQTFVIACNSTGAQGSVELGGHSRVIDPWGSVVAEAGRDEEVLVVEIDPEHVRTIREEFPVLLDRLPEYRLHERREVNA
jgi:predicted amidohydrolase